MKNANSSWWYKYRYLFIMLFALFAFKIINITPLNKIPHETLEYKIHFILIGMLYWLFVIIIFLIGRQLFQKNNVFVKTISIALFIIGLLIIIYPVKMYYEIDSLEKEANYYKNQADRLRKMGN